MIIKYLDTSGFLLKSAEQSLLIDPRSKKHGDVQGQYVYILGSDQEYIAKSILGSDQAIDHKTK